MGSYSNLEELFASVDRSLLVEAILNDIDMQNIPVNVTSKELIYIDRHAESHVGIPAIELVVNHASGHKWQYIFDAFSGDVLYKNDLWANAPQEIWSQIAYPATSTGDSGPVSCEESGTEHMKSCGINGLLCSHDFSPHSCVLTCMGSDSLCENIFGEHWKCWDVTQGTPGYDVHFPGYCYFDYDKDRWDYVVLYDDNQGGWIYPDYSIHSAFNEIIELTKDVIEHHAIDLGRCSYDGKCGTYTTNITSHCCGKDCTCPNGRCWSSYNCGGGATGSDGRISFSKLSSLPFDPSDLVTVSDIYNTLGHEWGHNVSKYIVGEYISHTYCMNEMFAQLYGSIMSVRQVRLDNPTFTWHGCGDARNPWMDETVGLGGGCTDELPYAHRSSFDLRPCYVQNTEWGNVCSSIYDCPRYWSCKNNPDTGLDQCRSPTTNKYHNSGIFRRFMRVFAEGTGTFSQDGNSEYLGIEIPPFPGGDDKERLKNGFDKVVDVLYEANLSLHGKPRAKIREFVDALAEAGTNNDLQMRATYALGIVGWIIDKFKMAPIDPFWESDATPVKIKYSAWQLSTEKDFYIFKIRWMVPKTQPGYRVSYRYRDGGDLRIEDVVGSNTAIAPAAVEFNNRLYIFWIDRSDASVKYVYIDPVGAMSDVNDLGKSPFGIKASAVDAIVGDNKLILAFLNEDGWVNLAMCNSTSVCTSNETDQNWMLDWSSSVPQDYSFNLGYSSHPGIIGVEYGGGIHGTIDPGNDYIYVATSANGQGEHRIRIDQVEILSNGLVTVKNTAKMPHHYPGSNPEGRIGIKMVRSAFWFRKECISPSSPCYDDRNVPRNYLYLAWHSKDDNKLYKSVVQRYDTYHAHGDPANSTWITWPEDTHLECRNGASIKKGEDPNEVNTIEYIYTDTGYRISYANLYGRY